MTFFEIGALKNFANFTGKHLCWSLFLIKLQAYSKQKQSFAHVLKNFVNFTGKHLCWSLFLIKFLTNFIEDTLNQVFSCKIQKNFKNTFFTEQLHWLLLSKETPTQVFACEICEIFKNFFFYRTPPVAASEWTLLSSKMRNNKNQDDFLLISCVFERYFRFPYFFPRTSYRNKAPSFWF